jgi:hypothetical protein
LKNSTQFAAASVRNTVETGVQIKPRHARDKDVARW